MMWKIGDLHIDGRAVLGPMSGFTSAAYRRFMRPFGASLCMTEMVSDRGVINGVGKTLDYVIFERDRPTGLQLFGHDPEVLAKAAQSALSLNPDIDLIDINMGCPVFKVIRNGSGSALMKDPRLCGEIVRSVKRSVDVPVTAKIRLGWSMDTVNFRDVISELTAADVDAVSVHARTMDERYVGSPHYDLVEGLQSEMPVPLVISGNIYSLDDAIRAVDITGAAAVMVARGGVGNPFLLTQIDGYFRTGERLPNPTVSQQVDWCMELADALMDEKGDEIAMMELRSIAPKFIAGCHMSREYRHRLAVETVSREALCSILDEVRHRMGSERIRTDAHIV